MKPIAKSDRLALYDRYISPVPSSERQRFLVDIIKKHLPGNRTAAILDLGCGNGNFIGLLLQHGYTNVLGVDFAPFQIAAAKKHHHEYIQEGDMHALLKELPDCSKDVVISIDLIEHLLIEELIDISLEVCRVLKPGGKWILETANAEAPFGSRVRYADLTHRNAFTRHSIFHLAKYSNFRQSKFFEVFSPPVGLLGMIRWSIWKIMRAFCTFWIAIETGESDNRALFTQNLLAVLSK